MKLFSNKWFIVLLSLAGIAYLAGLFLDIMEVDASQYASMSMEMLQKKTYLQILYHGENYLDKPPLLFWLSSLSYFLFGISSFAYRLPSFLFTLLGIYSTYRLASSLHNRQVGMLAATMLATCQAWFLFNHDVRTDTMLTGSVIFGIWQIHEFLNGSKMKHLILGFVGIGLAMLSKGPIGLIVPIFAFAPDFIFRRKWKDFIRWQWIVGLVVLIAILSPMLVGLYQQYGPYGFRFYFWIQSFGRITGENVWNNNPDPFFLYHSFLWAFLPWSFFAVYAIADRLKLIYLEVKSKLPRTEIFTIGGIVLTFISLSRSHYQLPHYIFVIFPLIAVITSAEIEKILLFRPKALKILNNSQFVLCCLLWIFSLVLFGFFFSGMNWMIWLVWAAMIGAAILIFYKSKRSIASLIVPSALTIIGINIILNLHFYPYILSYQCGPAIRKVMDEKHIPVQHIYAYKYVGLSLELSMHKLLMSLDEQMIKDSIAANRKIWVITDSKGFLEIAERCKPNHTYTFDEFHVAMLTSDFINPKTRKNSLIKGYILEFDKP